MNYLDLINRLRRECGVPAAALTSLNALSADSQRMADWVADAWVDIQSAHDDWQFMRRTVTFGAVPQKGTYTPDDAGIADTFENWKRDSFTCSTAGNNYGDEQELPFMDYEQFKRLYRFGASRVAYSRPAFVSVAPDKALCLGPAPHEPFVVEGDYYAKPIRFTQATDIPAIPEKYHLMIVFKAMMAYGAFEAATEVYGRGEIEYRRMMRELEIDRLPKIVSGPPLA